MAADGVDVLLYIAFPGERMSQADRNNRQRCVYDRNNGGTGAILAFGTSSWWLLHVWLKWSLWWIKKVLFPAGHCSFLEQDIGLFLPGAGKRRVHVTLRRAHLAKGKIFKTVS